MKSAPRPEPDRRWGDLRQRTLSAAMLAPVALVCVWIGGAVFAALVVAGFALLIMEWTRLCRHARAPWMTVAGAIWIAFGAASLWWLRADPQVGLGNLLFLLLVVWASDVGAYLIGRLVGGPKLVPHISPGKTWAGTLGGFVAAVLVGCAAGWLSPSAEPVRAAMVAAPLSVIGQLGDLAESWAKRRCGAKDSGTLIPGHGGLLDRLDALLAVAPFGALLAFCLGRGVLLWG
jgi:phosphatidate cytidylyltransferase